MKAQQHLFGSNRTGYEFRRALVSLVWFIVGFGLFLPLMIRLNIAFLCLLFRYSPSLAWHVGTLTLGTAVWVLYTLFSIATGPTPTGRSIRSLARWALLSTVCCIVGLGAGVITWQAIYRMPMIDGLRFTSARFTVTRISAQDVTLLRQGWKPWEAPTRVTTWCVGRCSSLCPVSVGETYTFEEDDEGWLFGSAKRDGDCMLAIMDR